MRLLRQSRLRALGALLLAPVFLAALACGDDAPEREQLIAPAIEACSRVGATGEVEPCQAAVDSAREQCLTLSTDERARCAADLDELLVAAQEAAHLFHGQCGALSSEAARSACDLAATLAQPSPTPSAPASTATPPPAERPDDAGEATPGAPLAGALWACGLLSGDGDGDFEDACARALEDAQDICDRLAGAAKDDCREVLSGLDERSLDGDQDRSGTGDDDSADNRGGGNGRGSSGNEGSGNNGSGRGSGNSR